MNSGTPSKKIPSLMDSIIPRPANLVGWEFPADPIPTVRSQGTSFDAPGSHSIQPITFGDSSVRLTIIDEVELTAESSIIHPETGNRSGSDTNEAISSGDASARLPFQNDEWNKTYGEMLRSADKCLDFLKRMEEQSEREGSELSEEKYKQRISELEDEVLKLRAKEAASNTCINQAMFEASTSAYQLRLAKKENSKLKNQLSAAQNSGGNGAQEEATDNGETHQEHQNCRKRAREEDPNLRDDDSSCSSVEWDYSNEKAEVQKKRKNMNNESTSDQNQK